MFSTAVDINVLISTHEGLSTKILIVLVRASRFTTAHQALPAIMQTNQFCRHLHLIARLSVNAECR